MKTAAKKSVLESAKFANRHLLREVTSEKISRCSLSSYGAAGLSFVTVVALMQMDQMLLSQLLAFAAFALAIPVLIFLAVFHENFLWYGQDSYKEFGEMSNTNGYYYFSIAGYGLFGLGYFLILWSVSWIVSLITITFTVVLLLTYNYVTERLSQILDQKIDKAQETDCK